MIGGSKHNTLYNFKKIKNKHFKHTTVKFNHVTGNQMLCKAKASKHHFTPKPPSRGV